MKKISIIFLAFLCILNIYAQDTITLKNRKVIHAYIIEKSNTKIKYKLDTISGYTTFITKLSNIKSIHYSNGEIGISNAQNPRSKYPFGINGGIGIFGVTGIFTGGIDYFVTPNLSAEISIGKKIVPAFFYSLGGKYWFANKYHISGFSPFVGLLYGGFESQNFLEIPAGISHISKSGFQTSLQLSYAYFPHDQNNVLKIEFRLGWRFK
jgi:hypothetical protein